MFAKDEILDAIVIDDNLLQNYTPTLSKYDYETEVDVNILGHIFEHSLNDIDEIQAQIAGNTIDKTKTKRKKDGVFYTPKYITKYIVENTVGALCTEKRNEFGIVDDIYTPDKRKAKKKELLEKLNQYQDWLLHITILDPACGSGAFLNQALDFLIQEHKNIDELRATLLGESLVLPDHEVAILENNIFGVDLNEESVEIARLSLWLRTARKGRKLNSLNNNIKCGNSLIDDVSVAGDKAFNWQNEFPQIFERGGFDVVIGNPPYVRSRELFNESEKQYYLNNFSTISYQIDLYKMFIEKSCKLLNKNGGLSFITPSVFLTNDYDKPLRKFLLDNYSITSIASTDNDIFSDASVKAVVFSLTNKLNNSDINFFKIEDSTFYFEKSINQDVFINQNYLINEKVNSNALPIINKLNNFNKIDDFYEVKNGIKVRKELLYENKLDIVYKPFILGKNIFAYRNSFDGIYIHYKIENEKLYTNQAFRNAEIFEQEKLITRQILGNRIITSYDNDNFFTDQTTYVINKKDNAFSLKYLLCLLNSKSIFYYFINTFSDNKVVFPKVKRSQILELPIKKISLSEQQPFIDKAETMLQKNKELQTIKTNFIKVLQSQYASININTKLNNWNELSFKDFCKELEKQKIKLTISEKAELLQYFETEQTKANNIQQTINQTDVAIDAMVYQLYELTDEEIKIIEQ